jgi:hypothetical protein
VDGVVTACREYRFWSPVLGVEAVRLSIPDDQNREFFMIVPATETGQSWRKARAEALDLICEAIDAGLDPGEVRTCAA